MSRKAQRAQYPDRHYNIGLRISGKEKNKILKAAKKENVTLSQYILYCVWCHMREDKGIPSPTTPKVALPTPDEHLRAYLRGEKLLNPCGEESCDMTVVEVANMSFCETCNVRID